MYEEHEETLASSGISMGHFLALWYLPACGLVGNIPVAHNPQPYKFRYSENMWR
jgi:hypothetical protein